ncbi:MAG: hypothetical protein IPN77_32270 [Sandaracinaceae bacterium]|nr:hypothetical protein [Sandaracinaceae bacterium]
MKEADHFFGMIDTLVRSLAETPDNVPVDPTLFHGRMDRRGDGLHTPEKGWVPPPSVRNACFFTGDVLRAERKFTPRVSSTLEALAPNLEHGWFDLLAELVGLAGGPALPRTLSPTKPQAGPSQAASVAREPEPPPSGRAVDAVSAVDAESVPAASAPKPKNGGRQESSLPRAPEPVPLHQVAHQLDEQTASEFWDVFIDETGVRFDKVRKGDLGRIVAVAVPRGGHVPETLRKGWHTTDVNDDDVIDARLKDLLRARVGILGLSALGVSGMHDGWATLVQRLALLTAASLPTVPSVHGSPRLHFWVEQHGATKPGCETLGMASIEDQVRQLEVATVGGRIQLHVIMKGDRPGLAWADLVAHTWAGASERSETRLRESGLLGTCLHEIDDVSENVWRLALGVPDNPAEAWFEALELQRRKDNALRGTLLRIVQRRVATHPAMWQQLLDKLSEYADGKAVDSGLFSDACSFIEATRPRDAKLSPQVELGLLTASVVRGNHLGATSAADLVSLQSLAKQRRVNNPRLACEADLVCAVRHTNAFRFKQARESIAAWEASDFGHGLDWQWRGRQLSQLGQIQAFEGHLIDSRASFAKACGQFQALDEPERSRELSHTSTYLMIAATDNGDHTDAEAVPDEDLRALINGGAGLLPDVMQPDALARLASSDDLQTQYVHHAIVRYLACRGSAADARAYLDGRAAWRFRPHHPWPLIDVWRAILVQKHSPGEDLYMLRPLLARATGTCRADGHHGVIQLIGETIAEVRRMMGLGDGAEQERLTELARSLPDAAARIEILRTCASRPNLTPTDLMKEVLPFNFR